jgi:FkbM family methyltransferase
MGEDTVLCRVLDKYLMYVDAKDRSITPHLIMNGFWESWITLAFGRHLKPGMRVVDVGANVGYYTMLFADLVGPTGKVWAYEPNPLSHELIHLGLDVNGYTGRVVAEQCIIGLEELELRRFRIPEDHSCNAGVGKVHLFEGEDVDEVLVDTRPLDVLLAGERIDFVKIDAEGSEPKIWVGMQALWRDNPDMVVAMEWTPHLYEDPQELLRLVLEKGGRIRVIGYDGALAEFPPDTTETQMLWVTR